MPSAFNVFECLYTLSKYLAKFTIRNISKFRTAITRAEEKFGYFWFIFNQPHEYDLYVHANKKSKIQKKVFYRPENIKRGDVLYYENPLQRIKGLHVTQREMTTGNIYVSPFPRNDTLF